MQRDELVAFCGDVERLLRINPMLEFSRWEELGAGRYLVAGRNISQEEPFEYEFELRCERLSDGLRISYSSGLKTSTTLTVESTSRGSKLTLTDSYDGLAPEQREARLGEVDKSITVWAGYLQKYLQNWLRWSRIGVWRWYMRRVWQPMKPSGRRITYMLLMISAFEVVLIALGVAIYYLEYA